MRHAHASRLGMFALAGLLCLAPVRAEDPPDAGAKEALKTVAADLKSADPAVRAAAVRRAAAVGTLEALGIVNQVYQAEKDTAVAITSAWAIAHMHDVESQRDKPDPQWKPAWAQTSGLLGAGLLRHRDDKEAVLATILAMAQVGDPAFVKPLSSDLWKIKEPEVINARILALGCIRDKSAIDTLVDCLYVAVGAALVPYAASFKIALHGLTGQNFNDRAEWKKWWRENRDKFQLAPFDKKARDAQRALLDAGWAKLDSDAAGKKGK